MKRSGKASWLVIIAGASILVLLGLILLAKPSPTSIANGFLVALAKGDVAKLTDMTYLGSDSDKESIRKKWDYATTVVSPHYRFVWKTVGESIPDDSSASVRIQLIRNIGSPAAFEEKYEIPLVKQDGKWLVDVRAINRDVYPGLPR